jgi:acyl-CoA synthetase (AMP-forming)/AMP-acid ligase II
MAAHPNWRADRAALSERYRQQGVYGRMTLAEAMRQGASQHRDVRMIFHSDAHPAEATLQEMYGRGHALAGALAAMGIGPGDAVAIQVPNWLEGAITFQAAMILGVVVVPVIHIYGPAEVGFILEQSGAKAFFCPDRWRHIDYFERLDHLDRSRLPNLEHVITLGEARYEGAQSWRELEARSTTDFTLPPVDADDVCLLIYTSGTTASPKGVQHTHNTLLAETRASRRPLDPSAHPAHLAAFPAGHIAGVLGITRLYVLGGRTVLMDSWDPVAAARLIEQHELNSTSGAPYYLSTLLDAAEKEGRDLGSMEGYMTGAAAVPPALVERADAAGLPCYRCYGSSEHPTITSSLPSDPLEKRAFTDGSLLPNNEVRIVDEEGRDVAPGEAGEVASRGPELFVGYRDEALNPSAFLPEGWFRTGDIGVLDADGFLTITDRKKDVIIRGGENIASKEVEDILARHPSVREVAVVAEPNERLGERVCAFVIACDEASITLADVQKHFIESGVARQKTPERIEVVEELPRTAAGKVKKFELRDRLRRESELGS